MTSQTRPSRHDPDPSERRIEDLLAEILTALKEIAIALEARDS